MIEIIELFKQKIPEGFSADYPEKFTDFKQIRYIDWPPYLQYQFLERKDYLGVEIHLESEKLKPLIDILKPYVDVLKGQEGFKQARDIYWDSMWFLNQKSGGAGRLVIAFPKNTFPSVIADAMVKLIEITFDDINHNLPGGDIVPPDSPVNEKDKTKYKFNETVYGKNSLVLAVIKEYVKDNPETTYAELEEKFPKSLQLPYGTYGVFTTEEEAIKRRNLSKDKKARYFLEDENIIDLPDSKIAVCNNWGIKNIGKFVERAKELGYQIGEISDSQDDLPESQKGNVQGIRNKILDALIKYYNKNFIPDNYYIFVEKEKKRCWRDVGYNGLRFPNPYYIFIYFDHLRKFQVEMQIPKDKAEELSEEINKVRDDLSNIFHKSIPLKDTRVMGEHKAIEITLEPTIDDLAKLDFDSPEFQEFCKTASEAMNILIEKTKFIFDENTEKTIIDEKEKENMPVKTKPDLNVILYGPPGTGKTYNSINYAVSIIDEIELDLIVIKPRAEVEKRFNELREEGRIEFITFHQSYSYEDFIQGLKPDTDGEGQLSFNRKDGLFKLIADRAMKGGNFDEIYEKFKDDIDGMPNGVLNLKTKTHSKDFSVRINSRGSCSIVPSTQKATEMTLTKRVIKEYLINGNKHDWPSYLVPIAEYIREKYQPVMTDEKNKDKNFVIIIDEINRANISRVFGELITLIEPDKRETLKVTLPSGEIFTVPKNLYIVGTMNTADKSIALLDIALRRRFKFIGKYPDYSMIPLFIDYLKPINEEIKKRKKSADFMIGHSYFMNRAKSEFAEIMNNEIIPLLNEYFNNKSDVVEEILKAGKIAYEIDKDTFQIVAKEPV
jgi:hypothetical protein